MSVKERHPGLYSTFLYSSFCCVDHSIDYLRGDTRIVSSTRLWRDENPGIFEAEVEEWEKRSASQFIYLYGDKVPGATRCAAAFASCLSMLPSKFVTWYLI
jgi:hypothetical protein